MTLPAVEVSQTPEEKFREFLATRSKPQRFTEQQRDLVRHIFSRHSHFDTDGLIDALREAKLPISRATVYRTLSKLVDAGLLRTLEIGPRTYYDHDYGYPQHHHLVCDRCSKLIEFQHPALEAIFEEVAGEHQFAVSGHSLVIRGTCLDCRTRSTRRRHDMI